jgi:endothelin-converting enzyme/putative endopeptidase
MNFKMLALAGASLIVIGVPALAQQPKPAFGTWGYNAEAMDSSVKPGDDFWDYVNGSWAKSTEIAPDRTFVGIDSVLNDQIDKDVRSIVEDMASNPASSGQIGQQVGDFYASWMDEAGIEARGTAPLKPYLAEIAAVKDRAGLIDLFATPGFPSPIGMTIFSDLKDPKTYSVYAFQSGLCIPNSYFYLLQVDK